MSQFPMFEVTKRGEKYETGTPAGNRNPPEEPAERGEKEGRGEGNKRDGEAARKIRALGGLNQKHRINAAPSLRHYRLEGEKKHGV